MSKSSQVVRGEVLALRDELLDNLTLIRKAIAKNRQTLTAYFEEFGDLNYRPITSRNNDNSPSTWGNPTEISVEPLATQMRTTIKSLVDTIKVIEGELLPEDNPEGVDSGSSGEGALARREALRAGFKADAALAHSEALPEPVDAGDVVRTPKDSPTEKPAKLVKNDKPQPRPPIELKAQRTETADPKAMPTTSPRAVSDDSKTETVPQSQTPRPWRDTTPRTVVSEARSNVEASIAIKPQLIKADAAVVGLSPALRASIAGTAGAGRLDAMRAKYSKVDEDSEE